MVIYEVNLQVVTNIYDTYYAWLLDHVKDILKIDGFKSAEIGVAEELADGKKQIRVSYRLESDQALKNYLTNHAPGLRADAKQRFGDGFTATRRVLLDQVLIEA